MSATQAAGWRHLALSAYADAISGDGKGRMDERWPEEQRRQALVSFLTTEHFTLQGARTAAVAETNNRLQVYMGVISMSVLALALAAQVSRLGEAFYSFAFVLLPVAYVFGVATNGRLRQSWLEWFLASQGMNRIRRFFVDVAPESERYLTLPATDDPWATLSGSAIRTGGRFQGFVTAFAVVALVNSIVGGMFVGLLVVRSTGRGFPAAVAGIAAFVVSLGVMMAFDRKNFFANIAAAEVRFPEDGPDGLSSSAPRP